MAKREREDEWSRRMRTKQVKSGMGGGTRMKRSGRSGQVPTNLPNVDLTVEVHLIHFTSASRSGGLGDSLGRGGEVDCWPPSRI